MDLRFANRRVIAPAGEWAAWRAYADSDEAAGSDPTRIVCPTELSEVERAQLLAAVAAVYGAAGLDLETFLTGRADEATDGVRSMPIEWWDIVDTTGAALFQLWLCNVDCGTLFHAGGTDEAGYVAQFHLDLTDGARAHTEALAQAQEAALADHPGSELASVVIPRPP